MASAAPIALPSLNYSVSVTDKEVPMMTVAQSSNLHNVWLVDRQFHFTLSNNY